MERYLDKTIPINYLHTLYVILPTFEACSLLLDLLVQRSFYRASDLSKDFCYAFPYIQIPQGGREEGILLSKLSPHDQ